MKKSNMHRALYDAVSDIDPALIDEVTAPRTLVPTLVKVAAAAAVLALLLTTLLWPTAEESYITGPGLLTIRAHALDEVGNATVESIILEEGVAFTPSIRYDPTISYRRHFPFSFSVDESLYSGMEITMEVNTNAGIFYKNDPFDASMMNQPAIVRILSQVYGQHFSVGIDKSLYWQPSGFDYDHMAKEIENGNFDYNSAYKEHGYEKNPSFIDVIIRADDMIVGYCVIAIIETNIDNNHPDREFSFEVLTIVSFPKVDGNWQNVALKYVQAQINQIHSERESATD